ncbi:MAG: nitrous oxide reductase accessory protein NosL [Desulfopila sp.]|jgi:nitrous oxide reductase accessory protein NosL|nr:nitrous oxide reductase accessory protein NosL [Desulfopila sp.]
MKKYLMFVFALFFLTVAPLAGGANPVTEVAENERCPVCGMFVAKYKPWLAQVQMENGTVHFFDGVKDMLAFFHEPGNYGGTSSPGDVYVTDYYSQQWIDGKTAYYVTGSDVIGPMGHEFVPLASEEAAHSFLKDHKGEKIYRFEQISPEMVTEMRSGMKGKKMHKMQHSN